MRFLRIAALFAVLSLASLLIACGDDDGGKQDGTATPTPTVPGSPTASPDPLIPPLEGPQRETYLGERRDFRQDPAYQLPQPNGVPTPSGPADPVFNLPAEAVCPDGWQKLFRGPERFQLCYPPDWYVLTDAYKNSPNEERWYTGGIFKFPGEPPEHQLAHVSMYAIPQFTRPLPYTRDCPTPYSVQLNSQPAVVCPSFPANHPEARIISYHVYLNNFDYFFNIALYYRWDESRARYTDQIDEDALATALQIIGSIEFLPETTPPPTAAISPGS